MTISKVYSSRTLQIALSLVCLYAIFLLLNTKTIHWPFGIIDSPIILAQAILYSPVEYLTSPDKYQFLTYNNFTPWVTVSWDLDYTLFQLEPLGYRVHQLLSAAILLAVVYLILFRLTQSVFNASIFSFAIISAPATLGVIDDLVNRHYLEGMIFCLLSFYCADAYNRKTSTGWLVGSVLLYGLSMTAKEVFIPLPGILFFYFAGSLQRKCILITPYALMLLACLAWRLYMLSGSGGYTSPEASLSLIENSSALFNIGQRLTLSLFFIPAASVLTLGLFALLLAINFRQLSLYTKLGIVIGVFGLVLPLLALLPLLSAGFHSPRWLFAPSIALLLFFSYLCGITRSRVLASTVFALVFAGSVGASYMRTLEPVPSYVKGTEKVYKAIMQSDANGYLRMRNYSRLGAQGQAIWVYIAKLHNGTWGTLTVSDVGQLRYHDTDNMALIQIGRRKLAPDPWKNSPPPDLPLINSGLYNPENGLLTFNFADTLDSENCFVYLFGEHNGFLFGGADCKEWSIPHRELDYLLRMIGYELAEVSIAVWAEEASDGLYSKPYKLPDIVDFSTF